MKRKERWILNETNWTKESTAFKLTVILIIVFFFGFLLNKRSSIKIAILFEHNISISTGKKSLFCVTRKTNKIALLKCTSLRQDGYFVLFLNWNQVRLAFSESPNLFLESQRRRWLHFFYVFVFCFLTTF